MALRCLRGLRRLQGARPRPGPRPLRPRYTISLRPRYPISLRPPTMLPGGTDSRYAATRKAVLTGGMLLPVEGATA
eukprot:67982-Rhodomonas_salina.1